MKRKFMLLALTSLLSFGLVSCGDDSTGDSTPNPVTPSTPNGDSTNNDGDSTNQEKFETKTTNEGGYFVDTGDTQDSSFRYTFSELKDGDDGEWNSIKIYIKVKWNYESDLRDVRFTSSNESVLSASNIIYSDQDRPNNNAIDTVVLSIDRSKVHKGTTNLSIHIDNIGMYSTDEAIDLAVPIDIVEYGNMPAETFDEYFTISFDSSIDKTIFDGNKAIRFGVNESNETYVYGYSYNQNNMFDFESEADLTKYSTTPLKITAGASTHKYSIWAYVYYINENRYDYNEKEYSVEVNSSSFVKGQTFYTFNSATTAESPIELVISEISK